MSPKERLFPEPPDQQEGDGRKPYERFSDLASKVLRVPKAEIDKRDEQWQRDKSRK